MDELDLFRGFRRGVAGPSDEAKQHAALRLSTAIEDGPGSGSGILRLVRNRPRRTALTLVALVGTAAIALFVSAPWKDSPGFLAKAQAALTTESILHYQWETEIPAEAGCAIGPGEVWIDQAPPQAYRAFLTDCLGTRHEIGGVGGTLRVIEFEAPNRLVVPDLFIGFPANPVAELREAIREDHAHDEGPTQLDGRTVERIRVECTASACPDAHLYVDPQTYFPVQAFYPDGFSALNGKRYDTVQRFKGFEYLPRTPANLALTDIRAQHPDATGP